MSTSPIEDDFIEAQRLYNLHQSSPLSQSDQFFLVDLKRRLYKSKLRAKMEKEMPATKFDSVWYHPDLNPSGQPPNNHKQVYLWQVDPLTEPLDTELTNK